MSIKKVTAKGVTYYYHRETKARIRSEFGTPEFDQEVAALDELAPKPIEVRSLGALIDAYRDSPEFKSEIAQRTRKEYDKILKLIEPLRVMPVESITRSFVLKLRDKMFKKRKRRTANYVLQVLSLIFNWGIRRDLATINPCEKVEHIQKPKSEPKRNRPWTLEEFYHLLDVTSESTKVAIAFAGYSAVSEADVLQLGPQNLVKRVEEIAIETPDGIKTLKKVTRFLDFTRQKTGVHIHAEMHPELAAIIDSVCVGKRYEKYFVATRSGDRYTEDGFRANLRRVIQKQLKDGKIGAGTTFHGLRHFVATALGSAGADNKTIMSILGQKTAQMAEHYSEEFDRRTRAAHGSQLLRNNVKRGEKKGLEN
jgi:integrase